MEPYAGEYDMEDSIHRRFQFQWLLLQPDLLVAGMELEKKDGY